MAVRPLRPATDRSLGGPLPRQLANRTRAPLQAPGLAVPGFDPRSEPRMSCGISTSFPVLFPTRRQITHALLTRSPLYSRAEAHFRARLACVRHAASVDSEPGSNSPVKLATPPHRQPEGRLHEDATSNRKGKSRSFGSISPESLLASIQFSKSHPVFGGLDQNTEDRLSCQRFSGQFARGCFWVEGPNRGLSDAYGTWCDAPGKRKSYGPGPSLSSGSLSPSRGAA